VSVLQREIDDKGVLGKQAKIQKKEVVAEPRPEAYPL